MKSDPLKTEARERAERARKYALMFPDRVFPSDPYSKTEWQEEFLENLDRKIQVQKP